ncbi:MAG: nitroreductase [Burkholderiaceae bacterium]
MKVSEALGSRISARAYSDRPVPGGVIRAILEAAARAPSGGNLQPWHTWVLAGTELDRFLAKIREAQKTSPTGQEPEYNIYPPSLKDPYRSRRFKCGEDLYATLRIGRDDKPARLRQLARNFEFFGAPMGLFFAIDRDMEPGQWADLGMYMQSIMLVAREHGLHTCSQEAWARWHRTVREFLEMPEELMLFAGMAIGYPDESAPINTLRTDRASLEEAVVFRGV